MKLNQSNLFTNDVIGWLTLDKVEIILTDISNLKGDTQ